MGQQLNPQPTSQLNPQQYAMPLYTSSSLQGYHLVVSMGDGHVIRQPFGLDSFFNSYAEFIDSGVLPHLIQILHIVYGVEAVEGDKSVWASLEKHIVAEGELHPTFRLAMNTADKEWPRDWNIRLVYETAAVARSVS